MANIIEIILKATDKTGGILGKAGVDIGKIGQQLTKTGGALTAGVTLPLIGIGAAAVSAASDLEESMSKVNVVFEDSAGSIQEWSKTAASSFGISRQQALEAAGTYGNLFRTMGVTGDAAAGMSTDLVELSADLASFNNLDPSDVLNKLRSGLVGETEPLKILGINLTAAGVEAKAMELGLADADGQISQSAMLQARYALILEQTTLAQGDFARTSDGLANSSRMAKAELADAAAQLGTQLLPIALQLVKAIGGLVNKFTALSPETQKIILIVGGLAAAIGPILLIVGQAIAIFGTLSSVVSFLAPVFGVIAGVLTGPVLLAIAAVVAVVGLFYLAWKKNIGGIQGIVENASIIIKYLFGKLVDAIKNIMNIDWGQIGRNIINGITSGIQNGISKIKDAAKNAAQSALSAAKNLLGIHSDSTVFKELGANIMGGWAKGIQVNALQPQAALVGAGQGLMAQAQGGQPSGPSFSINVENVNNGQDIRNLAYEVVELLKG